jgi:hypothetical protein
MPLMPNDADVWRRPGITRRIFRNEKFGSLFEKEKVMSKGHDPVQAVLDCQKALVELDEGFHAGLYNQLQEIYRSAEELSEDSEAYGRFAELSFWEKCKRAKPQLGDNREEIILLACRLAFRAVKVPSTRYNRAYKHARTLQRYARKAVPADEVAQKLADEHGSDYAFQLETEEHPRRTRKEEKGKKSQEKTEDSDDETDESGERAESDDEVDDSGDEEAPSKSGRPPSRTKRVAGISKSIRPRLSPDGEPVLDVEMPEKRLQRVLRLAVGGKALIRVECTEINKDWKRIVGTSVKILDE